MQGCLCTAGEGGRREGGNPVGPEIARAVVEGTDVFDLSRSCAGERRWGGEGFGTAEPCIGLRTSNVYVTSTYASHTVDMADANATIWFVVWRREHGICHSFRITSLRLKG